MPKIYFFGPSVWGPVNRHAGTPTKTRTEDTMRLDHNSTLGLGSDGCRRRRFRRSNAFQNSQTTKMGCSEGLWLMSSSFLQMCVCVCVFFPFILDIKFVGRTSRGHTGGRTHRISHPPSFCGACLNFSREKDSTIRSLVDCEVEFCVLTI